MAQTQKTKTVQKQEVEQEDVSAVDHEEAREKVAHSDELLEDIDALLSELGTETATNFKQANGQ